MSDMDDLRSGFKDDDDDGFGDGDFNPDGKSLPNDKPSRPAGIMGFSPVQFVIVAFFILLNVVALAAIILIARNSFA
ncbi:MAG: hypothetical protein ACOYL5_04855 [Phototrophicaceae bacterium]